MYSRIVFLAAILLSISLLIAEDIGSVNLLSNPGFELGSYNPDKFPDEWQYVCLAVTDINPEATHARITVQIRGGAKGSVWVDDLFFGEKERVLFRSIDPVPKLTGIRPNPSLQAAGFFRVEKISGIRTKKV